MDYHNVMLPESPMPYADIAAALEQSTVSWEDFGWIREAWRGRSSSKAFTTPATRGARSKSVPRRSSFPITAAANSTAFRRRCVSCRRSSMPSATAPRCSSTAVSVAERRRQGALHGRAGGADRPGLCVRLGRGWPPRRRAGHRNLTHRYRGTVRLLGCHDVAELDASYVNISFRRGGAVIQATDLRDLRLLQELQRRRTRGDRSQSRRPSRSQRRLSAAGGRGALVFRRALRRDAVTKYVGTAEVVLARRGRGGFFGETRFCSARAFANLEPNRRPRDAPQSFDLQALTVLNTGFNRKC